VGIESGGTTFVRIRRWAPALLAAGTLAFASGCAGEDEDRPAEIDTASAQMPAAPCAVGAVADGVTLVYATVPTPTAPRIDSAAIDGTVAAICARLDRLGVRDYRVRAVAGQRIRVDLGDSPDIDRAIDGAGSSDRLALYDWEPNVLGSNGPNVPYAGMTALHDALVVASTSEPSAEASDVPPDGLSAAVAQRYGGDEDAIRRFYDRRNDTHLGRCYLFDADKRLVAGPAPACTDLHGAASQSPDGARLLAMPRGIVVIEATRAPDQPDDVRSYFVVEDDSELSGADVANAEQSIDPRTNEPIVRMDFTDDGRAALAAVTKRVAQRGSELIVAPGTDSDQTLQRFAIALDDGVVSLAAIDHRESPEGIDGHAGAQINAIGDLQEMQDLAATLRIGPAPLDLELVDKR
jgi:preprotein translocase subunit SecD